MTRAKVDKSRSEETEAVLKIQTKPRGWQDLTDPTTTIDNQLRAAIRRFKYRLQVIFYLFKARSELYLTN